MSYKILISCGGSRNHSTLILLSRHAHKSKGTQTYPNDIQTMQIQPNWLLFSWELNGGTNFEFVLRMPHLFILLENSKQ